MSIACSIERAAVIVAILTLTACAGNLQTATAAVERAKAEGAKLEERKTPDQKTLNYRIHMTAALNALEKKRYSTAIKEAGEAEEFAKKIYLDREAVASEARLRLDKIKSILEYQSRPSNKMIGAYFDAVEALAAYDYETASTLIGEMETVLARQALGERNPTVNVQGDEAFYAARKTVPVYDSVSENGTPGKIIAELKEPIRAKYLGGKIVSRTKSFAHVFIQVGPYAVDGWVDREFID